MKMPTIGFGTWAADAEARPALEKATLQALQSGYRHIDTAWVYDTEVPVGNAVRASGIPRKDISITTKVYEVPYLTGLTKGGIIFTEMWRRVAT